MKLEFSMCINRHFMHIHHFCFAGHRFCNMQAGHLCSYKTALQINGKYKLGISNRGNVISSSSFAQTDSTIWVYRPSPFDCNTPKTGWYCGYCTCKHRCLMVGCSKAFYFLCQHVILETERQCQILFQLKMLQILRLFYTFMDGVENLILSFYSIYCHL